MVTPPLDEDYWVLRVSLSSKQAIVAFPKFGTYGVGFQLEDDWNTNLPYTCKVATISKHIQHNKQDESISEDDFKQAISMIRQYLYLMNGEEYPGDTEGLD